MIKFGLQKYLVSIIEWTTQGMAEHDVRSTAITSNDHLVKESEVGDALCEGIAKYQLKPS